jgi:hypothetical protein
MRIDSSEIIRLSIALTCTLVLYKMMPVISRQWQGVEACPALGLLPACYLVFTGYTIILLSMMLTPVRNSWMFLLGWLPVFLMALSGTSLELLGQPTCPRTNLDIPLCFFSLAIACILFAAFKRARQLSVLA